MSDVCYCDASSSSNYYDYGTFSFSIPVVSHSSLIQSYQFHFQVHVRIITLSFMTMKTSLSIRNERKIDSLLFLFSLRSIFTRGVCVDSSWFLQSGPSSFQDFAYSTVSLAPWEIPGSQRSLESYWKPFLPSQHSSSWLVVRSQKISLLSVISKMFSNFEKTLLPMEIKPQEWTLALVLTSLTNSPY